MKCNPMNGINTHTFSLGTILRFLGVTILICLVIWYVHFQARNFLTGPTIMLESSDTIVYQEQRVVLTGVAQNIVKLTLNGKEIHTNEEGVFTHSLVLEHGYTIMTLEAKDRFGRTTTLTREYVYSPTV